MENDLYVSLCIPTNGITEWVVHTLDNIYRQKCDDSLFEVIVSDNGNNEDFKNEMLKYQSNHSNFIYHKTDVPMFINQLEVFKPANGKLLKFINHRMQLLPGSLQYFIDFAKNNYKEKPITYFINGELHFAEKMRLYDNFADFFDAIQFYSCWSAGISVWKDDLKDIDLDNAMDDMFSHMIFILFDKSRNNYIVDDTKLTGELCQGVEKKGKFDIFYAFIVQYSNIILQLYDNGDITENTCMRILYRNVNFIKRIYHHHIIQKRPCSYILDGFEKAKQFFPEEFDYFIISYGLTNIERYRTAVKKIECLKDM